MSVFSCVTNFILFQKYTDLKKNVTKKIKSIAEFLTSTSTIATDFVGKLDTNNHWFDIYILEQFKDVSLLATL